MDQTEHKDHAMQSPDLNDPEAEPYTEALEHAPTHQTAETKAGSFAPFPTAEFPDKLAEEVEYGPSGIAGLASNGNVFGAAFLASLGGFSFGYDQGVISVINVHPGKQGMALELLQWLDLFKKKTWRRTVVGVGAAFFQQVSGINAFIYYAPTLFTSLGQGELSLILAGTLNIGQLVAVVAAFIIDKVGRRPLVIWGAVIMGTPYVIIAALYGLYSHDWPSYPAQGWTAVAMAYIYIIGYGISYSPLAWTLPSEVYSTTQRAKGAALATATVWISNFIVGVATPPMIAQAGFGTYVFFAIMCLLAMVWAIVFVPETMSRTLEEIDEVFGDTSGHEEHEIMRSVAVDARSRV